MKLKKIIKADWINADNIRRKYNDWDFSKSGIIRQATRMRDLAKKSKQKYVIADFVCPFEKGMVRGTVARTYSTSTVRRTSTSTSTGTRQSVRTSTSRLQVLYSYRYSSTRVLVLVL